MDDRVFDTLARSVSGPSSRRGLLGGFTALVLGLGGANLPDSTTARKKRKHKRRKKNTSTTCQPGTDSCQGKCVNLCPGGQARNPLTCGCCQMTMGTCSAAGDDGDACCSGTCGPIGKGAEVAKVPGTCTGRDIAAPCDFDAQCASGFCSPAGLCLFPAS
jgi:hypothetical protein